MGIFLLGLHRFIGKQPFHRLASVGFFSQLIGCWLFILDMLKLVFAFDRNTFTVGIFGIIMHLFIWKLHEMVLKK